VSRIFRTFAQATAAPGPLAPLLRVRMAGDATPDGSAGQAGANDNLELTFNPDHYVEADRFAVVVLIRSRYPLVVLLSTGV
jgi:hypothetical protein